MRAREESDGGEEGVRGREKMASEGGGERGRRERYGLVTAAQLIVYTTVVYASEEAMTLLPRL